MGVNCDVVAVIPDVGGHVEVFRRMVASLGVDPDRPVFGDKLTVVQVGDLVHKGSASAECVAFAQLLMDCNGPRYVQLVGNHEAHYLGGPSVAARKGVVEVDADTRAMLRDWWASGAMRMAFAMEANDYGGVLITHGGVTRGFFEELGSPGSAAECAAAINELRDPSVVFRPGALPAGTVTANASPVWARTGTELIPGWLEWEWAPFTQIHGHDGAWSWQRGGWKNDVPERVRERLVLDPLFQQSFVRLGNGHRIWSIDPAFGVDAPKYVPPVLRVCGHLV